MFKYIFVYFIFSLLKEIGLGGTSAWKLCGFDSATTLAVFFEIVNQVSQSVLYCRLTL